MVYPYGPKKNEVFMPNCTNCGKWIESGTLGPECQKKVMKQISSKESKDDKKEETTDSKYAFARKSSVQNQGEDIPLSRRHVYHMYNNVSDIPEIERAKYLTLKNLIKNEKPNIKKADAYDSIKAKDLLDNFPKNLESYIKKNHLVSYSRMVVCKKPVGDNQFIYKQVNLGKTKTQAEYEAEGWFCDLAKNLSQEDIGQMYLNDYRKLKDFIDNSESFNDEMIKEFSANGSGYASFYRARGRSFYLAGNNKAIFDIESDMRSTLWDIHRANKTDAIENELIRGMVKAGLYKDALGEIKKDLPEIVELAEENKKTLKWAIERYLGQKREKGPTEKGKESYDFYIYQERSGGRSFKNIAEAQSYLDKVGLRGIQFGNTIADSQREAALFRLAEAVSDMEEVIGVDDFSFDKSLAVAFGARGKGRAIAHYEPSLNVINITKKGLSGGALAHEWGHAFDFKNKGILDSVISDPEVKKVKARLQDEGRRQVNKNYWNSDVEIFARMFEKYVHRKFQKSNRNNSFLVGGVDSALWPNESEIDSIMHVFDGALARIKEKKAA